MNQLILAIATGCYSGKIPKAPGTWGSLAAFVPWFFFKDSPLSLYLLILILTFVTGCLAAGSAEKLMNSQDPGAIVIDEIVGMFITLFLVPDDLFFWIIGFVFFRIFDIAKPFPVSWFDKNFHGGLGIMLDDVMAGIYAFFCLQGCCYLFSLFFENGIIPL